MTFPISSSPFVIGTAVAAMLLACASEEAKATDEVPTREDSASTVQTPKPTAALSPRTRANIQEMLVTYEKWVQTSPEISNPYMGKRMPSCGTQSDWKK